MLRLRGQQSPATRHPFVCALCIVSSRLAPPWRSHQLGHPTRSVSTSAEPPPKADGEVQIRRIKPSPRPRNPPVNNASALRAKSVKQLQRAQGAGGPFGSVITSTAADDSRESADPDSKAKEAVEKAGDTQNVSRPVKGPKKPKAAKMAATTVAEAAKAAETAQINALSTALNLLKTALAKPGTSITITSGRERRSGPIKISKEAKDIKGRRIRGPAMKSEESKATNTVKSTAANSVKSVAAPAPATSTLSKSKPGARYHVQQIEAKSLSLVPVGTPPKNVPSLQYGLERALFNPGVYHLQDPRSKVYNFDPYLATIMPIQEFDFNALRRYVTTSKDDTTITKARGLKKRYTGSTSSMTSLLTHFHYLLSQWRPINPAHTSRAFSPESFNFTRINRAPAAALLHWKDGVYAIDADKEFDTANILSMLGQSMEKLLTLPTDQYELYRKDRSHELTEAQRNGREEYHYSVLGDFLMRSQLDAHDGRLPGTGMFDLKTRAVVSIRMDAKDFHSGIGYEIRNRIGQWESFEREYYDMIRSAFLKYSLQVRMGRMDGIYVAFHNTQRIFGFQFISINEMDLAIHGTEDQSLGDREFMLSIHLLNQVLNRATARFPNRTLRIHIETRPSESAPFTYIFAQPVTEDEIEQVQENSKRSLAEFESEFLGMASREADSEESVEPAMEDKDCLDEDPVLHDYEELDYEQKVDVWESLRSKVEETMDNEALGVESIRDTLEDALEQSGLLRARSAEESRRYVDALLDAITNPEPETVAKTLQGTSLDSVANEDTEADGVQAAENEMEDDVVESEGTEDSAAVADDSGAESIPVGQTSALDPNETQDADVAMHAEGEDAAPAQETGLSDEAQSAIENQELTDPVVVDDAQSVVDIQEFSHDEAVAVDDTQSAVNEARELADNESLVVDNAQTAVENQESANDEAAVVDETQELTDDETLTVDDTQSAVEENAEITDGEPPVVIDSQSVVEDQGLTDEEPFIMDEDAEHGQDEAASSPTSRHSNLPLDNIPLKDLIIKLAEQIEATSTRGEVKPEPEDSHLETVKNRRFERILSEMVASAKQAAKSPSAPASAPKPATSNTAAKPAWQKDDPPPKELLGMVLTIRNKVDSRYVERPDANTFNKGSPWTVEYAVEELKEGRARTLFAQCKTRRRELMNQSKRDTPAARKYNASFMQHLKRLSEKGQRFRAQENAKAKSRPVQVFGAEKALKWEDIFTRAESARSKLAGSEGKGE